MPERKCTSEIRCRDDFFSELSREIARVRRYGHRITLLLIEPEEQLEATELQEFKEELIKQLRSSDCAFCFGENQFAVILPNTHEAGGEAAALRIKRRICSAMNRRRSASLALSTGVISLDSGVSQDMDHLVTDLVKDLDRDKRCQAVDLKKGTGRDTASGKIVFTGSDNDFISTVEELAGEKFGASGVEVTDLVRLLTDSKERPVVIMGPFTDFQDKKEVTENIRFNRELNDTYIIWLQNGIKLEQINASASCDILMPEKTLPEVLWPVIKQGFDIRSIKKGSNETEQFKGMLNAIGSAAHQLNQPLQIILGRLELFMLNMEDVPENREMLDDIKTIRSQALLAADINKKIGRLTKYDSQG